MGVGHQDHINGVESCFSSGLGYLGLDSLELQASAGAQRGVAPALLPSKPS